MRMIGQKILGSPGALFFWRLTFVGASASRFSFFGSLTLAKEVVENQRRGFRVDDQPFHRVLNPGHQILDLVLDGTGADRGLCPCLFTCRMTRTKRTSRTPQRNEKVVESRLKAQN